jgi:outer membrane protein TolC
MKTKIIFISIFIVPMIFCYSQSLEDYLVIAKNNSPELQAKQYYYESALEKVNESGSLPNTNFSGGYFIQEPETRVGAQKARLSASQSLPWFGTLSAKKESALFNAKAKQNAVDIYLRELYLEVKRKYFHLYELYSKQAIYIGNLEILNTYEKIALNELEQNRSTMVDVLKIKIQINKITNELDKNRMDIEAEKRSFNILLNRNEEAKIIISDKLEIEDIELVDKDKISQNPKLIQYDNIRSSLMNSEVAAKKESMPIIGVGLDYVFVEERDVADLTDNGKDIIMPMVSVSIPLFSKRYNSRQKQLQLDQKAIESTMESTINQFNMIYENASAAIDKAKSTLITQEENLIQAEQAHRALLSSYETGSMDLDEILEIQLLKLDIQLRKIEAEKEYADQLAILHYLTKENKL